MPDFMTIETLEKALAVLLADLIRLPVVIENSAEPRPSGPFGSVKIISVDPEDFEIKEFDPDTEEETLRGESYISGRIVFYGKGAFDNIRRTINALNSSARQFDLFRIMGFSGFETAKDASVEFEGALEERADVLFFGYAALGGMFPADFFTSSQWGIKVSNALHQDDMIIPKRN